MWGNPEHWFRITFPRDLDEASVVAALSSWSGLSHRSRLVLEVIASDTGIEHRLAIRANSVDTAAAELRAAAGSLRLDPIETQREASPSRRLMWQSMPRLSVLRTDNPEASAASLLSSLWPLAEGESVRLTWRLRSTWKPRPDTTAEAKLDGRVRAIRTKLQLAGLAGHGELAVHAPTAARARFLMNRTGTVLRGVSTPFGSLVAEPVWLGHVLHAVGLRGRYLSARELAAVIGWPIGGPEHLPGVALGAARRLVPSRDIPEEGRVIGTSDFPGLTRPVALPMAAATRHSYILGPTGTGKTSLITNLMRQDIDAGRGVAVVDTNGDLAKSLLDVIPERRLGDVVYLDPYDESPIGLNPLAVGQDGNPELVADQMVELFHRVWQSFWGPRSAQLFHLGLGTLTRRPGSTLVDLTRLFVEPAFRREAVGNLDDPIGLGAGWAWYERVPERERLSYLGPVFNKLFALTARRSIRHVLGQAEPRITLSSVLADQRILIVNLAKGVLGVEAARLLGALVVTGLWQAATERATMAAEDRTPFMVYLDELQDLLAVPVPFDEMLSQGRKYGLALNLAHQNLGQLTPDIREAILANAHSKLTFRMEPSDARIMARSFEPSLTAADLQALGAYEAAAVVALERGGLGRPVTLTTQPPTNGTGLAGKALAASRRSFGRPAEEVEAELRARSTPRRSSRAPVGRKARTR